MIIKRKASFLLLEMLIAITILALSAPFIFYHPLVALKEEVKCLEDIECERIAFNSFNEIKLLFYQGKIAFPKKGVLDIPLDDSSIIVGKVLTKKIVRKCFVEKYKKRARKQSVGLLEVKIILDLQDRELGPYTELFFVQRPQV